MNQNLEKNFKDMQKFMDKDGSDAIGKAVELYQDTLRKYADKNNLKISFVINGSISLCLTQLNHTIKSAVSFSQHTGATKAEVYDVRQEIAAMIRGFSDEILTDEWYKYEEHMT